VKIFKVRVVMTVYGEDVITSFKAQVFSYDIEIKWSAHWKGSSAHLKDTC
jgi:hypothetical protein